MLTLTDRRVVQANLSITQIFADADEGKKQAAEFLAAQVYQLYDERRVLVTENDDFKQKNADLQRLMCQQREDLNKYQGYVTNQGPSANLINKVDELQDLIIQ